MVLLSLLYELLLLRKTSTPPAARLTAPKVIKVINVINVDETESNSSLFAPTGTRDKIISSQPLWRTRKANLKPTSDSFNLIPLVEKNGPQISSTWTEEILDSDHKSHQGKCQIVH